MPDFFLEGVDTVHSSQYIISGAGGAAAPQSTAAETKSPASAGATTASGSGEIVQIFNKIQGLMDPEMVKKTNAVFQFDVKGNVSSRFSHMYSRASNSLALGKIRN